MIGFNSKPLKQIKGQSKGETFDQCPFTFDYALPQQWLDEFADWCSDNGLENITYHLILGTTVWGYPETHRTFGCPVTCCCEVLEAMERWQRVAV